VPAFTSPASPLFSAGFHFLLLLRAQQAFDLFACLFVKLVNFLLFLLLRQRRIAANRLHLRPRVFFNLPALLLGGLRHPHLLPAGLLVSAL
jgi:hypothetical protein